MMYGSSGPYNDEIYRNDCPTIYELDSNISLKEAWDNYILIKRLLGIGDYIDLYVNQDRHYKMENCGPRLADLKKHPALKIAWDNYLLEKIKNEKNATKLTCVIEFLKKFFNG